MSNIQITSKVNIDTLISNIYGSVDNSATYQIQNLGGDSIIFETVIDSLDETKNQNNVLLNYGVCFYKKGTYTVNVHSNRRCVISINKMEE